MLRIVISLAVLSTVAIGVDELCPNGIDTKFKDTILDQHNDGIRRMIDVDFPYGIKNTRVQRESEQIKNSIEGRGGEGSGFAPMSLNDDDLSSTFKLDKSIQSTTSTDIGSPRSRFLSVVDKRATEPSNHKLGNLPIQFMEKMDFRSTNGIPPSALMAMGRPLKKGEGRTENEYVVLLVDKTTSSRRWGRLFLDSSRIPQAQFIDNNRVVDGRSSNLSFRSIILPPDAASTHNVGISWIQGRLVDPLSIVVQTDTRRSYPKITAGVFVSRDYEYLGEADVENKKFTYVENGQVAVVKGNEFDESVFVMTKESCSCACQ